MSKKFSAIVAFALISALLISAPGCYGSFSLTKKVYEFNGRVGDKWVNELVFLVFATVQVYSIAGFIDGVVLNSIEFWTGKNPLTSKIVFSDRALADGTVIRFHESPKMMEVVTKDNGTFYITKEETGFVLKNAAMETVGIVTSDANGTVTMTAADGTILSQQQIVNVLGVLSPGN